MSDLPESSFVQTPLESAPRERSALGELFFDFPTFAQKRLDGPALSGPLWFLPMYITGVAAALDNIETRKLLGLGGSAGGLDSWLAIWPIALFGALIGSFVGFYIWGLVYHCLVKLAGGRAGFGTSANINLYGNLPLHLFLVAMAILNTVVVGDGYWRGVEDPLIENIGIAGLLACAVVGIANRYRASKRIQNLSPVRGVIFLVVCPALFYVTILSAVVASLVFGEDESLSANQAGIDLDNQGDYEEAIRQYDIALREVSGLTPGNKVTILQNKAMTYLKMGNSPAAIGAYREALALAPPRSIEAILIEGSIGLAELDVRGALAAFNRVLELDGNAFEAHNYLGLIYLGDYDDAFTDWERSLFHNQKAYDLQGGGDAYSENLGRSHYWLNNYDLAIAHFESLALKYPGNIDFPLYLAYSFKETNRPREARRYFERAFAIDPGLKEGEHFEAFRNLGENL